MYGTGASGGVNPGGAGAMLIGKAALPPPSQGASVFFVVSTFYHNIGAYEYNTQTLYSQYSRPIDLQFLQQCIGLQQAYNRPASAATCPKKPTNGPAS